MTPYGAQIVFNIIRIIELRLDGLTIPNINLRQMTYHQIDPMVLTCRNVRGKAWESCEKNVFENYIFAITTGSHWSQCIKCGNFPLFSHKMSPNIVIAMSGTANFPKTVWVAPSLPERMSTSLAVVRVINSTGVIQTHQKIQHFLMYNIVN